jgi:hypothetical protein
MVGRGERESRCRFEAREEQHVTLWSNSDEAISSMSLNECADIFATKARGGQLPGFEIIVPVNDDTDHETYGPILSARSARLIKAHKRRIWKRHRRTHSCQTWKRSANKTTGNRRDSKEQHRSDMCRTSNSWADRGRWCDRRAPRQAFPCQGKWQLPGNKEQMTRAVKKLPSHNI